MVDAGGFDGPVSIRLVIRTIDRFPIDDVIAKRGCTVNQSQSQHPGERNARGKSVEGSRISQCPVTRAHRDVTT